MLMVDTFWHLLVWREAPKGDWIDILRRGLAWRAEEPGPPGTRQALVSRLQWCESSPLIQLHENIVQAVQGGVDVKRLDRTKPN